MDNITEILKTIRQYFNLLLVITAASIGLLLTPQNVYQRALNELDRLETVNEQDYKNYLMDNLDFGSADGPLYSDPDNTLPIIQFASNHVDKIPWYNGIPDSFKVKQSDGVSISIVPYFIFEPPFDKPLTDWEGWLAQSNELEFYAPDFENTLVDPTHSNVEGDTTMYVQHIRMFRHPKNPNNSEIANVFSDFITRKYIFQMYLDANEGGELSYVNSNQKRRWWTELDSLFHELSRLEPDPEFNYTQTSLEVDSLFKNRPYKKVTQAILVGTIDIQKEISELPISQTYNSFTFEKYGLILPGLKVFWSEISDKKIPEAKSIIQTKELEERAESNFQIFGISGPLRYAALVIPIAYLLVLLYILVHLRYLKVALTDFSEPIVFPWIGLYDFSFARAVFACTLIVLPVSLSVSVLVKYWNRSEMINSGIPIVLIAIVLLISVMVVIENASVRQKNSS